MNVNINDIIKSGQLINVYEKDGTYYIPYKNNLYRVVKEPLDELKTLFSNSYTNEIIVSHRELYDYIDISRDIRTLSISLKEHIFNAFMLYNSTYLDTRFRCELLNTIYGINILDDYYYILNYDTIDLTLLKYCRFGKYTEKLIYTLNNLNYGISYNDYKKKFSYLPRFIFDYLGVYALGLAECFILTKEIKRILFKVYGIDITKDDVIRKFIYERFGNEASTISRYLYDCTRGDNCG